MQDRRRSPALASLDRNAAALGFLTVVAANFIYLAGLSSVLDPMMSMEPYYIDMARRPVSSILAFNPAWGPLYALWLKPFRIAFEDPVTVYAANVYGLSFGVSTLIYLHLLLLTERAAVAAGVALFFLVCDFNVPLPSKVNGFALMVVLVGLTLAQLSPAGARRMTVAALTVLVASYVRPELYPAALCLLLIAGWLARREFGLDRGAVAWPATGLVVTLLAGLWIGTPLFSPYHTNDRLFVAFREHFAWNWGKWHEGSAYYLAIWQREFDDAQTISQAFLHNPGAVLHHLADNLIGTLKYLVGPAFRHYPFLVPVNRPRLVSVESWLLAAATFGTLCLATARTEWRRRMIDRYGHVLLPYAFIAAFCFASSTLIFPRSHYLVLPGVLIMLSGGLAATVMIPPLPGASLRTGILAAVVTLAALPRPFTLPTDYATEAPFLARITLTRKVTETVELIRSLRLPPPVHVLTFNDGVGEMLGEGFHEIKVWQRGTRSLEAYIENEHVDVIVTLEPGQQSFLVDDPYWKVIQFTPETTGFTPVAMPGHSPARIWVRSGLVKEAARGRPGEK